MLGVIGVRLVDFILKVRARVMFCDMLESTRQVENQLTVDDEVKRAI